jgi:multicomponent Na+:H+ antiporter subunit G
MAWIRFILGTASILFGVFFIISSVVGNFKFKFALNRMHSAALGDTLGLLGIMVGLCFYNGINDTFFKMLTIIAIIWVTSPIASHLIMLMEISDGRYTSEVKDEFTDEEGFEKFTIEAGKNALDESEKAEAEKEENK